MMDETVWEMATIKGRQMIASGITVTPVQPGKITLCSLDGEPFNCRVWIKPGAKMRVYPTQNFMSRSQATEVAIKFADALQATYLASIENHYQ
jgi:hypothetical protein